MVPLSIAIVAVICVFAAALILGFLAGRAALEHKYAGEALLANTLNAYAPKPNVLINNVTLQTERGTTQIDHILILTTGIFVIETKHYQGWIFGNPDQKQWTQVIYHAKNKFQNPIHQNYAHLKALQSLFNLPEDNFIPLVVFTGSAEFKSDLGPNVLKLRQLISFLTAPRQALFDERKMTYITGRIEMNRLRRSIETDEYHLNHVRRKLVHARLPGTPTTVSISAPS